MTQTRAAYLTIDDSPSERMDDMVDALVARGVPAIFFCRGDHLAVRGESAVRAIRKGFVIANHAYHHRRSSQISFDEVTREIADTQNLIDDAYQRAGVSGMQKYFRFPHMDRGTGGWIVDYDAVPEAHRETVVRMFADGLNVTLDPPDAAAIQKKSMLQDWLRAQGFVRMPCGDVTFPWFSGTEMTEAVDAMYTFSTSDWMLLARHKGKWPYKSLDDLRRKIDTDPWLQSTDSAHIILAHDNAEIHDETIALIDYCLDRGIRFKL